MTSKAGFECTNFIMDNDKQEQQLLSVQKFILIGYGDAKVYELAKQVLSVHTIKWIRTSKNNNF